MTRQGWAERKVNAAYNKFINTYPIKPWTHYAAQTLLAEHKRAVRVVEQEIEAVKNDQRTYRSEERCLILGSLETVLNGLNNEGGSEYVGGQWAGDANRISNSR